ncbi:CoA transferase [Achromobacter sp. GG226]|uniref:CaiB/BaiF CoA transferase family protein n=1 Tax=Verticiella alkaliphila TaxID=2779529 RepID=UPI001C0E0466|nr:CaiB/BaiF CoA-transferase family protein [Verticiella sp. GG226]MBU4611954.1 CoA transferase [Verticiella sp. GG226]
MQPQRSDTAQGPLAGLRVVEFAGIGPGPFACMMLADMGADVVSVDRPGKSGDHGGGIVGRGRRVVQADLKQPADCDRVLALLEEADVLIEGFRPGVMERLGLGPDVVAARNPRLVYGRMTGWGQTGPLAQAAGHDINYISIAGALHAIGPAGGAPVPPLNLVGDYGGGSLYLLVGILAALHEAKASGKGQIVDAAISDGTLSLMSLAYLQRSRGQFGLARGSNLLDGGAPFYGTYETADGQYVSIGSIEPQFFALACERLAIPPELREAQYDTRRWPALREAFATAFRQHSRAHWVEVLEGTDACFAPVLDLEEAALHPHNQAREALVEVDGVLQPAPAPRFSRTPSAIPRGVQRDGHQLEDITAGWRAAR